MDRRSNDKTNGVVVLPQTYGHSRVALIVLAVAAVSLAMLTLAGFADTATWLEYPFLIATIGTTLALLRLRKRAYLISGDEIAERSGIMLGGASSVRLDDVVAVTWYRSVFPNRTPRGCVLWASRGGHRRGLPMWPVNQIITTEVHQLRRQLETQHGKLGAILIDYASVSPSDRGVFLDFLRDHRFAPLPTSDDTDRNIVSYPPA